MARMKNIVHSGDACTMIFKGNKANPEPSLGVIKFPGGYVEVSRCSDGSYYAHLAAEDSINIIASRIDYDYNAYRKVGIPQIPNHAHVKRIAIKIKPTVLEITGE